MTWLQLISILFSVVLSDSLIAAEEKNSNKIVRMLNWYDFIAPETPKEFSAKTGIALIMDSFDSAEMMQSKVMAGNSGYDVIIATSNTLPQLISAGVLEEIDHKGLSNWSNIDPEILSKLQSNDPGNRYAVPYLWGTTGIGFDEDKVRVALGDNAPTDSWDLLFKEQYISKLSQCGVALLDSPSEIISIALHYLGLPHNSQNPDDYVKAKALLLKIRPHVRYFDSSRFGDDLANGNLCMVVGWAGSINDAKNASLKAKNGRNISYRIPREGTLVWSENMVLVKGSKAIKQGLELIDYLLIPEVIAKTSNHTGYPSANLNALPFVDVKLSNNKAMFPDKGTMRTLFPLEPLPLAIERIRTRVWTSVKSGT